MEGIARPFSTSGAGRAATCRRSPGSVMSRSGSTGPEIRAHGVCRQWLRRLASGFSQARFAGVPLRRRIRECVAVSCAGRELPRVLREFHATLKPGGVLFSSNPRRPQSKRPGTAAATAPITTSKPGAAICRDAGFVELAHYYRPPGLPRNNNRGWLPSGVPSDKSRSKAILLSEPYPPPISRGEKVTSSTRHSL